MGTPELARSGAGAARPHPVSSAFDGADLPASVRGVGGRTTPSFHPATQSR